MVIADILSPNQYLNNINIKNHKTKKIILRVGEDKFYFNLTITETLNRLCYKLAWSSSFIIFNSIDLSVVLLEKNILGPCSVRKPPFIEIPVFIIHEKNYF